jgi:hypothetical protein
MDMALHHRQQLLVVLGELRALVGLEVQDADDGAIEDERHRELGLARLPVSDEPRIVRDVI